ncbi:transposase [Streptomyces griseorubiginosus]|nr:transposase [Streptomyces griseorubiginosus]
MPVQAHHGGVVLELAVTGVSDGCDESAYHLARMLGGGGSHEGGQGKSRQYTEEFKRDAVALVHSSGKTVTEVARQLGVSAEGLRNWVKQDAIGRGQGAPGDLTTAEREELRRLRRLAAERAAVPADPAIGQGTHTALQLEDSLAHRRPAHPRGTGDSPHPAVPQQPGLGGQRQLLLPLIQMGEQHSGPGRRPGVLRPGKDNGRVESTLVRCDRRPSGVPAAWRCRR